MLSNLCSCFLTFVSGPVDCYPVEEVECCEECRKDEEKGEIGHSKVLSLPKRKKKV
jgi:hypothetical protein